MLVMLAAGPDKFRATSSDSDPVIGLTPAELALR
ncbi:hypothetical protein J2808_000015 [Pseudarthrobacter sulfonivorans]|nr:hypothetical protein [Pseudarthrobacter sulfonivorans]